ncbi:MAG: ribonuclease D [Pseudomonadales bacterium]|nr:ribonuclease D [Pseudomonadales bacterium]
MTGKYELVVSTPRLKDIVDTCRNKPAISVDTEFARFNTYYPIVGLIQLYDGDHCYLIDPLEVEDLSSLSDLFQDPAVVKVFHACSEDMEVFQHTLGVLPAPVFDAQIAAAVLGVGFSISYQNLVEHYLSLHIDKGETRSDWLQRPLSDKQLDYAAQDVIYLLQVYEKQQQLLQTKNRLSWLDDECRDLAQDIPTQIDPLDYYRKVKNISRLDARQLTLLRSLCAWRERMARELDIPRNRVVEEKSLFIMAQLSLASRQTLQAQANLSPKQLRRYAEVLIEQIESAQDMPNEDLAPVETHSSAPVSSKSIKALRALVEQQAKLFEVAPELLAKRRHLERLLRSGGDTGQYQLPDALKGWREQIVGQVLLQSLNADS